MITIEYLNKKSKIITYKERAKFYDIEYTKKNDRSFLKSFIKEATKNILEIPCGSGRNFRWLCKLNKNIYFADIEREMINILGHKIDKIKKNSLLEFGQHDMRTLIIDKKFDLIIVPQSGIQLLENKNDVFLALKSLKNHLLDHESRLIIDIAIFEKNTPIDPKCSPSYFDPYLTENKLCFDWEKKISNVETISRFRMQSITKEKLLVDFFYIIDNTDNDNLEKTFYNFKLRLLKFNYLEFKEICDSLGFHIVNVFKNYKMEKYTHDTTNYASRNIYEIIKAPL